MPSAIPAVSRRRVLLGAAALAVFSAAAASCGSPPGRPKVDDLQSQLELARRDSGMAQSAAAAADSGYARALAVVAAERSDHARALAQEINRTAGRTPPPTETSPASTAGTPAAPAPPPSLSDVTAALRNSAESATALAAKTSGYRAGLLGSIAASCTASVTVALATKEPAQ
jgi:hypothetical protein